MEVALCSCGLWFDIINDQYTGKGVLHGFVGIFLSHFCETLFHGSGRQTAGISVASVMISFCRDVTAPKRQPSSASRSQSVLEFIFPMRVM